MSKDSKPYEFTLKTQCGAWEVQIDPEQQYGCFENQNSGSGGGLWFEKNRLIDADGTCSVPKNVIKAIRELGFVVPREFE
jgi:hypothetical protein